MLEVGPTGQRPVAATVVEAFARWLHHRYAVVEFPSTGRYRLAAPYLIISSSKKTELVTWCFCGWVVVYVVVRRRARDR